MAAARGLAGKSLVSLSLSLSSFNPFFSVPKSRRRYSRVFLGFNRTLCSAAAATEVAPQPLRHSLLLDRLRSRNLKDASKSPQSRASPSPRVVGDAAESKEKKKKIDGSASSFEELGIGKEVMGAVREMGISVPTEIQCIGVPAVLEGKSVVLGSHTGSGKTLAYLLPLVQLLRNEEEQSGMQMKPRRPRVVVLCPTRELSEQVYRVSKSISHHARFRSTMISGGVRLRPQEDSLNVPVDMVVGTPGRIIQHLEDENMVYGDIKYVVLDEADTMFDKGFGPDIRKFLTPLKNRASKPGDQGFQTVLVAATMTKAVQKLIDEEFEGIIHLRTSSLHKKVPSARHDFIKLSGTENKLESLLQVLEPSLSKGNRVMIFCNTLNSSRAVDHFLSENQIFTVNYHGEVPAEERVENLKKFKSEEGDCPTMVCTDLAARGLDLDVDHVIMFDFPSNSIDYLHRTGRTARMGAKGKVTSLVAKKDNLLATRIEEALRKNESLESLTSDSVRWDVVKSRQIDPKGKNPIMRKNRSGAISLKPSKVGRRPPAQKPAVTKSGKRLGSAQKPAPTKLGKISARSPTKGRRVVPHSKPGKYFVNDSRGESSKGSRKTDAARSTSKLRVVGFRGRSSSGKKEQTRSS